MNFFARQAVAFTNDMRRSCGALLGIAHGLLADGQLNDAEIRFLDRWLTENASMSACWPGNVLAQRVKDALADGFISTEEREQLVRVLEQLVGGDFDQDSPIRGRVSALALDELDSLSITGAAFCLTGEFAYGPRGHCEKLVVQRGGAVHGSVTKKLNFLVVGGLGSDEWKHGSFGTKIEKAMQYKAAGVPIRVVHEDVLMAAALGS